MSTVISPLHLYVHIPFCIHKCAYCDFNSHVRKNPPWESYRQALVREITYWAENTAYANRHVDSIFFGGGTPSLAPPWLIESLIRETSGLFGIVNDAEITLEANPGSVEADRFSGYRTAGVNRLSIGVQSFDNNELNWLERAHNGDDAKKAFAIARHAGFDNINLDLIYGLPDQSVDAWQANLDAAIDLAPEHLSCYQLTIEPHTELAVRHKQHPLSLPSDDKALEMLWSTRRRLEAGGFEAYEVSNFSRPGRQCRHNDGYWLYHDYIGIGAGASGKRDTTGGGIIRYINHRSPEAYLKAVSEKNNAINTCEALNSRKSAAEAVWLGLRRTRGLSLHSFVTRFSQDMETLFGQALAPWIQNGSLLLTPERLMLSDKGLGLADSIAVDILTG